MKYLALSSLLLLTACGGGVFGDSKPASATYVRLANPPTPSIVAYSSFDLADSILADHGGFSGGNLNDCQAKNIINPDWPYNYGVVHVSALTLDFFINGSFTLPFGDDFTCNTNGMTGTISSASTRRSGSNVYYLNNLNMDAASIQNTWREFWQTVLAQTGTISISQPSNASITCTNLMGQHLTIAASPARDISNEIRACVN